MPRLRFLASFYRWYFGSSALIYHHPTHDKSLYPRRVARDCARADCLGGAKASLIVPAHHRCPCAAAPAAFWFSALCASFSASGSFSYRSCSSSVVYARGISMWLWSGDGYVDRNAFFCGRAAAVSDVIISDKRAARWNPHSASDNLSVFAVNA